MLSILVALAPGVAGTAYADLSRQLLDVLDVGSRPNLGLGGDPFLSEAMGETGWWRMSRARQVRVSVLQDAPITQRSTGNQGELGASTTRLAIADYRRVAAWGVASEVTLQHVDSNLRLRADDAALRFTESGPIVGGAVLVETPIPGVATKLEFPVTRGATKSPAVPFAYGVHVGWRDRLWLSGTRRAETYGVPLESSIEGETLTPSMNLDRESTRLLGRLGLWNGLAVEASYDRSAYAPDEGITTTLRDEFQPFGESFVRQVTIDWRGVLRRFDVIARHTNSDLRAHGNGYWGGQRYLRFSHASGSLDGWLVGAQWRAGRDRYQLDVESTDMAGFARFDFEGWRFGRSNFIAGKKVAQGGGEVTLHRYRLGYESNRNRGRLRTAFTWYDIRPTTDFESWIKVVLVRDEYERTQTTSRYSVGAVSLGGDFDWRGLGFEVDLHQFVFVNDHEGADDVDPEPPGPGSATEPTASGWYGGTFLELSLVRAF